MKNPTLRELQKVKLPKGLKSRLVNLSDQTVLSPPLLQIINDSMRTIVWQRDKAIELLEKLIDPDECSLDHHGYCQAHGLEKDCSHEAAKEFLK